MNLVELQNKIHSQNKEMGWWDEERPFHVFVCLFHSELSEAMEGHRKNLNDDHLPQYPMFQVELADFAIRCLDWLGSCDFTEYKTNYFDCEKLSSTDALDIISRLHLGASGCLEASWEDDQSEMEDGLAVCVELCFSWCDANSINLHQIISDKVEYNRTRPDHQPENRAKKHGKKY